METTDTEVPLSLDVRRAKCLAGMDRRLALFFSVLTRRLEADRFGVLTGHTSGLTGEDEIFALLLQCGVIADADLVSRDEP